jgi:hypothetical protein
MVLAAMVMASYHFHLAYGYGRRSSIQSPRSSGERDISITRDTLKDLMLCHAAIALGCSRSDLPDITFSCKFTMSRLPQIYSLGVRQHSAKSGSRTDDVDEPRFTS